MIGNRVFKSKKYWIWIGVLLTPLVILCIGLLLFPDFFYDHFIWKYFWGPIVEDATNYPASYHGINPAEKFTFVSELVYGVLVLITIYGLYRLLEKWKISIDFSFLIALMPYIICGSVVRVLEDAQLFTTPLAYWFVTPLIYFQILFLALIFLVLGHVFEHKQAHRYVNTKTVLFAGGVGYFLPFLYYVILWMSGYQWSSSSGVRFDIILLVSGLIVLSVFPVYLIGKTWKNLPSLAIYAKPLNVFMLLGHMLDGITSYVSIYDPLNMNLPSYVELHPASNILMQFWPPLFPLVKFILIIMIIFVFDMLYKNELLKYPRLVNLLKIGIFILGFAPGLRDILRVSMGV
jgi:uncharacterized membrane protein